MNTSTSFNTSKLITIVIAVAVVVGSGAFYGGMKYGQNTAATQGARGLANLTPEERQARMQQFGSAGLAGGSPRGTTRGGGGFTAGEIISKDDKSITVKLNDGGSKIIFLTGTTPVTKNVSGTSQDLAIGKQVSVTGTANQDGSISAQSIQVRPDLPSK
ncbi:MAG: hypothetical protein Q7R91_00140 [bacterium]|nr:hypothetical protein [bacterium]